MKKYLWIIVLLMSSFSYADSSSQKLSAQNSNEANLIIQLFDSKIANLDDKLSHVEQDTKSSITELKTNTYEKLNDKSTYVGWWLNVLAIWITLLGVLAPIFGYILNKNIDKKLKGSAEDLEKFKANTTQNIKDKLDYVEQITRLIEANYQKSEKLTKTHKELMDNLSQEITSNDKQKSYNSSQDIIQIVKILSNRPENSLTAEEWFIKGLDAQNHSKLFEAITYYNNSITIEPKPAAYNNRGNSKKQLRLYSDAINDYNQALQICTEDYKAVLLTNRGNTYRELAKLNKQNSRENNCAEDIQLDYYNKAMADYQFVLQINPEDFDALINLGLTLKATTQFDTAVAYLSRALQINPNDFDTYYNLALIYIDSFNPNKNLKTALDYLDQSFKHGLIIPKQMIDKDWKEYLENPEFKILITKYANKITK